MAHRDDILATADQLLDIAAWSDYCPNGMQVLGGDEVTTIVSGVSANQALLDAAHDHGAQMVISHHGLFWRDTPQVIGVTMRGRLRTLLTNEITLAGYHLPLDAHPEIGNNALLERELGLTPLPQSFAGHHGRAIGRLARFAEPLATADFVTRVAQLTQRAPQLLGAAINQVATVAICSGGGAGYLTEAAAIGADILLTGEPSEQSQGDGRELGIALLAAGHHATETFGIRALGDLLATRHAIRHTFVNIDNPI